MPRITLTPDQHDAYTEVVMRFLQETPNVSPVQLAITMSLMTTAELVEAIQPRLTALRAEYATNLSRVDANAQAQKDALTTRLAQLDALDTIV